MWKRFQSELQLNKFGYIGILIKYLNINELF